MTDLTQPGSDRATSEPPFATVSSLIESAAAFFETDPKTTRELLTQACALLRAKRRADQRFENGSQTETLRVGLPPWQVIRAVTHVETHLDAKIHIQDLAKLVDLSASYFSRKFKLSVGIPPFKYIRHRRIEFAMELLKTTREPMSQIAILSGLSDQAHLCKVFRRTIGQSPGAWRRNAAR